ncbi:LAETG motif-containing sortase-dependent surface protein [Streptomyces sp. NPDC059080]|uniref:LAETG motif-containing sortase-dependent surface protein n=1 Tax=Streptomyces sp. NPDC059080 TaxID=3346718 RepID=UPI0036B514FA
MTARRPLLTAAAAGSVLIALWFVPTAHAIVGAPDAPATGARTTATTVSDGGTHGSAAVTSAETSAGRNGPATVLRTDGASARSLAETGSPDTTPYVIGGAACLALGAGLVSYSVRRSHDGAL